MRIILSRKGFDSAAGGVANPILPDGELLALPIPDEHSPIRYKDVRHPTLNLGRLVHQLTNGKVRGGHGAHLDPDLNREFLDRDAAWLPLFGQAGAAAGHLRNHGIEPGDLFLFFSWFREVEFKSGKATYKKGAEDKHIIYGWFQIDRIIQLDEQQAYPDWTGYHPHHYGSRGGNNQLYIARNQLNLDGFQTDLPGAGTLSYHPDRVLTAPRANRGVWRLPAWFLPGNRPPLSYHHNPDRYQIQEDGSLHLNAAYRGQEFVLHCDHYPESLNWARHLLRSIP